MILFGIFVEGVEIFYYELVIVIGIVFVVMVDEKVFFGVGGVIWWREEEKDVLIYKWRKKNIRFKIVVLVLLYDINFDFLYLKIFKSWKLYVNLKIENMNYIFYYMYSIFEFIVFF